MYMIINGSLKVLLSALKLFNIMIHLQSHFKIKATSDYTWTLKYCKMFIFVIPDFHKDATINIFIRLYLIIHSVYCNLSWRINWPGLYICLLLAPWIICKNIYTDQLFVCDKALVKMQWNIQHVMWQLMVF